MPKVTREDVLKGDGPWDMSVILKLPIVEEIMDVLGTEPIYQAFKEYMRLHPSHDPIKAQKYLGHVFAILGEPSPTYTTLFKRAYFPPTDEPWAECLFCWRVKSYLEGRDCNAVNWETTDYYAAETTDEEKAESDAIDLQRYSFILEILERLQARRFGILGPKAAKMAAAAAEKEAAREESLESWERAFSRACTIMSTRAADEASQAVVAYRQYCYHVAVTDTTLVKNVTYDVDYRPSSTFQFQEVASKKDGYIVLGALFYGK
ncbi:hypothetical protein M426DRAFT_13995 [Hypoxylon sp. CI-4A]|nr:hypothetical protein M426DRAFT_13995 [Hypoxylon sp. CI-4A]